MTREKMKSIFTVHTNGQDEYIKVPKRTYDKMIDMFCDAHEADLKKACEILEGANLAEIERHFAECKAKDERIAELEAIVEKMKRCENCANSENTEADCFANVLITRKCITNAHSSWRLNTHPKYIPTMD